MQYLAIKNRVCTPSFNVLTEDSVVEVRLARKNKNRVCCLLSNFHYSRMGARFSVFFPSTRLRVEETLTILGCREPVREDGLRCCENNYPIAMNV
jgi:hypothetical protein